MTHPSVSVVMPFYNEIAFLELGVKSVLSQRIEDVEVVIVNDNPALFDQAFFDALGFPANVRVVHHAENAGLSAARNTGIDAAKGTWIGFLDSDDYYLPMGLRRQFDKAVETGADMVHGIAVRNRFNSPNATVCVADANNNTQAGFAKDTDVPGLGFGIFSSWSSLYRRDFLINKNVRFDPEQRIFEDRLFVVNAISQAGSLVKLGEPVRVWRMRNASITTTPNTVADSLLKLNAFDKCIDCWLGADGLREYAAREFVRAWVHMLTQAVSSPYAHAFAGDDSDLEVRAELVRVFSKFDFTEDELRDALQLDKRCGTKTDHRKITPEDFNQSIKSLKSGDFDTLAQIHAAFNRLPVLPEAVVEDKDSLRPELRDVEFIFHVGLHKTGSTYVQNLFGQHRDAFIKQGILFPETGLGFPDGVYPVRPGGVPGHQALLHGIKNNREIFDRLAEEITASGCKKVLISAENLSAPIDLEEHKKARFENLLNAIGIAPSQARVVAMVRRPDIWLDSLYREMAGNGLGASYQSADEFLLNFDQLTSLPALLGFFEEITGKPVQLGNFDALKETPLGAQVMTLCGLDAAQGASLEVDRGVAYPSPCNAQVQIARLVTNLNPVWNNRKPVLQAFFSVTTPTDQKAHLMNPTYREKMVRDFDKNSAQFANARGYTYDLDAWLADISAAHPAPAAMIPDDYISAMQDAATWAAAKTLPETFLNQPAAAPIEPWSMGRIARGIKRRIKARMD